MIQTPEPETRNVLARARWGFLTIWAFTSAAACDVTDVLGPIRSEEVSIEFLVSGGIAGVSDRMIVDGSEGLATYECSRCASPTGEHVIPMSAAQVERLASHLEDGGVFDLDGRDFGGQCCDVLGYTLTYRRGDRVSHVTGDSSLWPTEMAPALWRLSALTSGVVPLLFEPDTDPDHWPQDPIHLRGGEVTGNTLILDVQYGGGCAHHRIDLVAAGGWIDDTPLRVRAFLAHDDGGDVCDAFPRESRRFGLASLLEAYEKAFGPVGGDRPTVVLEIEDPFDPDPLTFEIEL